MIQALGSNNRSGIDAEYMRMMQEMRAFGLSPSGNKTEDAQKLNQAKTELVQRVQKQDANNNNNSSQELGIQVINQVDGSEYAQRSEMEEQRLGAMNIAALNKFYFGL